MADRQVVWLKADAPAKPAPGLPCNGCGVCCAAAPCPLSRLLLKHRAGPCPALEWEAPHYRCGLMQTPRRYLPRLPRRAEPWFHRLARRYLAIGRGCDSWSDVETIKETEEKP